MLLTIDITLEVIIIMHTLNERLLFLTKINYKSIYGKSKIGKYILSHGFILFYSKLELKSIETMFPK